MERQSAGSPSRRDDVVRVQVAHEKEIEERVQNKKRKKKKKKDR